MRSGMELKVADLGGAVHYADFGGDGPPIVLVHGLGGSHLNWAALAPQLTRRGRVLAIDLPGFGLSPPPEAGTSIEVIQCALARFIEEVAGAPAVLMGSSMGGLLSLLVAADTPGWVSELVLVGPAQPLPSRKEVDPITVATFFAYAMPGLGDFFVDRVSKRLGPEGLVRYILGRCCVDLSRVSPRLMQQHVELAQRRLEEAPWGDREFLRAARSMIRLLLLRPQHVVAAARRVRSPALIIHGRHDLLVPVSASIALADQFPHFHLSIMEDAGHTPMLEHPRRMAELYASWSDAQQLRETA